MGKMSDLDLQIKELRSCGETIIGIANTLAGMFSSQAAEDAPPKEKPKALTLEEVRHRMTVIAQAGYSAEVKALITKSPVLCYPACKNCILFKSGKVGQYNCHEPR